MFKYFDAIIEISDYPILNWFIVFYKIQIWFYTLTENATNKCQDLTLIWIHSLGIKAIHYTSAPWLSQKLHQIYSQELFCVCKYYNSRNHIDKVDSYKFFSAKMKKESQLITCFVFHVNNDCKSADIFKVMLACIRWRHFEQMNRAY